MTLTFASSGRRATEPADFILCGPRVVGPGGRNGSAQDSHPMTPTLQADPVPLRRDEAGALRVGSSRVPLDTVVQEFEDGADPEGIVRAYPTLQLADVYAVIAYYLRHRGELDEYLRRREEEAAALKREIEARQPNRAGLRERLLARKAQQEQGHATPRG